MMGAVAVTDDLSIFERYYKDVPFVDRYVRDNQVAVDVIIPIIHTNELWETNLKSIYREVPVNRLLISDGGCKDDSIEIVKKFPRVTVYDHKDFISLGYCLKKLIEAVETEWFIYIHSDIYLPEGYFDIMKNHQTEYDWFASSQRITAMVDYRHVDMFHGEMRPSMGSQMGLKQAFMNGIEKIDDDFVYRQEDFVLADIVESSGFKYGYVDDIFHYHQVMHKDSPWSRDLAQVSIKVKWSREEELRMLNMQIKGVVKYLKPTKNLKKEIEVLIVKLIELGQFDMTEFKRWVRKNNSCWLPHVSSAKIYFIYAMRWNLGKLRNIYHRLNS